jgi:hypothetical protein
VSEREREKKKKNSRMCSVKGGKDKRGFADLNRIERV